MGGAGKSAIVGLGIGFGWANGGWTPGNWIEKGKKKG